MIDMHLLEERVVRVVGLLRLVRALLDQGVTESVGWVVAPRERLLELFLDLESLCRDLD